MALEPITRQEQIIAGKDLEPITRMEKFLKQYGGGSSGIAIKKAVFTDRPTIYQWLLKNYSKVIFCNVISTRAPWYVKFSVNLYDGVNFGLVQINSFGKNTLVPSTIQITSTETTMTIDEGININADNSITGEYVESVTIPDEYWSVLQIEGTVYYFDE